jgi:hypothetical protein
MLDRRSEVGGSFDQVLHELTITEKPEDVYVRMPQMNQIALAEIIDAASSPTSLDGPHGRQRLVAVHADDDPVALTSSPRPSKAVTCRCRSPKSPRLSSVGSECWPRDVSARDTSSAVSPRRIGSGVDVG